MGKNKVCLETQNLQSFVTKALTTTTTKIVTILGKC